MANTNALYAPETSGTIPTNAMDDALYAVHRQPAVPLPTYADPIQAEHVKFEDPTLMHVDAESH